MRILVIESDAASLKLIRTILISGDHEVVCADSVINGLTMAADSPPELIVMDVQLAEMDDFSAIRYLKTEPRLRSVPVIAATAMALKNDRERILEAGYDHYIAKPIRYREVLELVAMIAENRGT